jgi:hypothetical protein
MIRQRSRSEVVYGHFAEALGVWEQLNQLARDRGWAEATFLVPLAGLANELVVDLEYPDLATLEKEDNTFNSDPDAMNLLRQLAGITVQSSARNELFVEAPHLA